MVRLGTPESEAISSIVWSAAGLSSAGVVMMGRSSDTTRSRHLSEHLAHSALPSERGYVGERLLQGASPRVALVLHAVTLADGADLRCYLAEALRWQRREE